MPDPAKIEAIKTRALRIKAMVNGVMDERIAMRRAILDADRDGHSRNAIAEAAEGGLSRRLVFEYLGAVDLVSEIKKTLRDKGVDITYFSVTPAKDGDVSIALSPNVADNDDYEAAPEELYRSEEEIHAEYENLYFHDYIVRRNLAGMVVDTLRSCGYVVHGDSEELAEWESLAVSKPEGERK